MVKKCPKCGTIYQDDVKFCINCGMKLTYEVPEHTYYNESSSTWKWVAAIIAVIFIVGGAFWYFNMTFEKTSVDSSVTTVQHPVEDTQSEESQQESEEDQNTQSQLAAKQVEAAPVSNGEWWAGAIGGKYSLRMYINEETGEFWYYYTRNSSDNRLYLTVVENNGDHLVLLETNKNGLETGKFDGYINGDTYSGTFYNLYNGNTFGFSLNRQ